MAGLEAERLPEIGGRPGWIVGAELAHAPVDEGVDDELTGRDGAVVLGDRLRVPSKLQVRVPTWEVQGRRAGGHQLLRRREVRERLTRTAHDQVGDGAVVIGAAGDRVAFHRQVEHEHRRIRLADARVDVPKPFVHVGPP
jgi:hypothetical protein